MSKLNCAICKISDGTVVNIIIADPSDVCQDGCILVPILEGQIAYIDGTWDGNNFVSPVALVEPESAL